jgi:hypothetical protein
MDKYPSLSLSCIATIDYQDAVYAICRSLVALPPQFGDLKVYWFSDIDFPGQVQLDQFQSNHPQIRAEVVWINIPPFERYQSFNEQLSRLTLELLPKTVETEFNLIVQNDGYAVNADSWSDEFLRYDYIGASWPHRGPGEDVGNGGFCLRSKKLYQAIEAIKPKVDYFSLHQEFKWMESFTDRFGHRSVPEDYVICTLYCKRLTEEFDIRFAPTELANQFSVELNLDTPWLGRSFGFHGFLAKSFYPDA